MAAPAGSGSWLTLISGVAAGEPSGGGEGLLFPFAGALSLQREMREREPNVREGERKRVCVTGCVRAHVCVHVDPGKLRVLVCPQTH